MAVSRHGHTWRGGETPLYRAWQNMRDRCNNPHYHGWKNYGGRGIIICERWNTFENFRDDMGPHPGSGWSLDRIDNNGNYELSNCRWSTAPEQHQNKRTNKLTAQNVLDIRNRYVKGRGSFIGNSTLLAKEFGVEQHCIVKVANRKRWANV